MMKGAVCKRGHALVEENIKYFNRGRRMCLICWRTSHRERARSKAIEKKGFCNVRSLDRSEEARFEFYCCYTGDCIVWTGATDNHGYGIFSLRGGNKIRAHAYGYRKLYGPIPEGLEPDHLCRNPICVNGAHLEAVTHQVNVQRGAAGDSCRRRGAAVTHCKRGHELSGENVYLHRGHRGCRQCRSQQNSASYEKKKMRGMVC